MSLDKTYFIIGGTSKAGTTSVFNYFSAHSAIESSKMKETRFFLDYSYPISGEYSFEKGDSYDIFFSPSIKKIRMEATPDYLHCSQSASYIRSLKNVKILFILREPISRFISWYHFSLQNGFIDKNTSIQAFYTQQHHSIQKDSKQYQLAYIQGFYSRFLQKYSEQFSNEEIKIITYDSLKTNLPLVLKEICQFLNINEEELKHIDPKKHNETFLTHSPKSHYTYKKMARVIKQQLLNLPILLKYSKKVKKTWLDPLYVKMNKSTNEKKVFTDDEKNFLKELQKEYKSELNTLSKYISVPDTWYTINWNNKI